MDQRKGEKEGGGAGECFTDMQRLKAAVHYTVACLCEEVAEDKETQFSKQAITAISEITFRQCDIFAKDLEMFASGYGKRQSERMMTKEQPISQEDMATARRDHCRPGRKRSVHALPYRHAKRSTINVEDVKLLARRSNSLLRYITQKSEELALNNLERKDKRKKKSGSRKERTTSDEQPEPVATGSEDSNMA